MSRKRVRLTTPQGVAKFPALNEPNTRFNPDGEYNVKLLLDPAESSTEAFLKRLDELADEAFEEAKQDLIDNGKKGFAKQVKRQPPYKMELDQEGEETGLIEVNFKQKAYVKTASGKEYHFEVALFDAKGEKINKKKVLIYGGSVIKVNYTPKNYYVAGTKMAGVSLQLNAVQVIELVTQGGGNAESYGFDTVEDGYDVKEHLNNDDDSYDFDNEDSSDNEQDVDVDEGADF